MKKFQTDVNLSFLLFLHVCETHTNTPLYSSTQPHVTVCEKNNHSYFSFSFLIYQRKKITKVSFSTHAIHYVNHVSRKEKSHGMSHF